MSINQTSTETEDRIANEDRIARGGADAPPEGGPAFSPALTAFMARVEELAGRHLKSEVLLAAGEIDDRKFRTHVFLQCLAIAAHIRVRKIEGRGVEDLAESVFVGAADPMRRTRKRLVLAIERGVRKRRIRAQWEDLEARNERSKQRAAREAEPAGIVCRYLQGFSATVFALALRRAGRTDHLVMSIHSEEGRMDDDRAFGLPYAQHGLPPEVAGRIAAECLEAVHRRAARLSEDLGFSPADVAEGLARWEEGRRQAAENFAEMLAEELEEARDFAGRGRGILCPHCSRLVQEGEARCPVCERQIG